MRFDGRGGENQRDPAKHAPPAAKDARCLSAPDAPLCLFFRVLILISDRVGIIQGLWYNTLG